jgi:hypothetical protein
MDSESLCDYEKYFIGAVILSKSYVTKNEMHIISSSLLLLLLLIFSCVTALPEQQPLLYCARNNTLQQEVWATSNDISYNKNVILDFRLQQVKNELYYVENHFTYVADSVSKLIQVSHLDNGGLKSQVLDSKPGTNGRYCSLSNVDSNGNFYVVSRLYEPNRISVTKVIAGKMDVSIKYNLIGQTDVPIYDKPGNLVGYMDGNDASNVGVDCSEIVEHENIGSFIVKSSTGSVVIAHINLNTMTYVNHTILLPDVLYTQVDSYSRGQLRVDPKTGTLFAVIKLSKDRQIAFEKYYNLEHNTVIQIPADSLPTYAVQVLLRVNAAAGKPGTVVGIKQITIYEDGEGEHPIDTFSLSGSITLHVAGNLINTTHTGLYYMRYDSIEKIGFESKTDPSHFHRFNSSAVHHFPRSISAEDGSSVTISGTTSPSLMNNPNAFLMEYNSKTNEALGYQWAQSSQLSASIVRVYDGRIFYVQQRGDSSTRMDSSITAVWCKGSSPSPDNNKKIIAAIIGSTVGGILVLAIIGVVVGLLIFRRSSDQHIERSRLL